MKSFRKFIQPFSEITKVDSWRLPFQWLEAIFQMFNIYWLLLHFVIYYNLIPLSSHKVGLRNLSQFLLIRPIKFFDQLIDIKGNFIAILDKKNKL